VRNNKKKRGKKILGESGRKKDVGKKFRENNSLNSAATCNFFFSSFNKISILHFF
jgi:hypothetical protein